MDMASETDEQPSPAEMKVAVLRDREKQLRDRAIGADTQQAAAQRGRAQGIREALAALEPIVAENAALWKALNHFEPPKDPGDFAQTLRDLENLSATLRETLKP